eukprot:gene7370-26940_t
MDQATAQNLFAEGAFIIVQGMPIGTEFGIDYNSWNIGPQFQGVKMIPPGLHFVYYSAVAGSSVVHEKLDFSKQQAPRTGFFTFLEKRQIVVKKWNPATEELDDGAASPEVLERFRSNLKELDRFLGPYPFDDGLKRWLSLTGKISRAVASRLEPRDGKISAASMPDSDTPPMDATAGAHQGNSTGKGKAKCGGSSSGSGVVNSGSGGAAAVCSDALDCEPDSLPSAGLCSAVQGDGAAALDTSSDDIVPVACDSSRGDTLAAAAAEGHAGEPRIVEETPAAAAAAAAAAAGERGVLVCSSINFSTVNLRVYPENSTPAQITQCNMDRSYCLSLLLEQLGGDHSQLLGELQYAFVCFEFGHVYDAFEQWKQLLVLLCTCDAALRKHSGLFYELIGVLHFQLRETPEDFFLDIVSRNNFLAVTMQTFFEFTNAGDVDPKLAERARKFKQMLETRFQWIFDVEEDEEDMPLVVDLGL